MGFYKVFVILTFARYSFCRYTGFSVWLWLSSDEDLSPLDVWTNASSSFNSASNATVYSLISTGTRGYRNTLIDTWSSNPPDRIRVTYRNRDGDVILKSKFKTSTSTSSDWFTVANSMDWVWPELSYNLSLTYTRHTLEFAMVDSSQNVLKYRGASLKLSNGTVIFVVGQGTTFGLLPSTPTESGDCYASYDISNPVSINFTISNLTHSYCSALCRQENYTYAGAHKDECLCFDTLNGPLLTSCNIPCAGNINEMCGGTFPPAIIFNSVNTDIDISQFNTPKILIGDLDVIGNDEISFDEPIHMYGLNITTVTANLPVSIHIIILYRSETCNSTGIRNSSYETSFSVEATDNYYMLEFEPIFVQCVYFFLYDNSTNASLTFPVNIRAITIEFGNFVTAQYFTIEASWQIVESTTSITTLTTTPAPTDECECECWLYNLLYGDSPYNNLSYDQIEDALKNVTKKIEKELSVNKSTLSSTIRRKTSAQDDRPSATAIGYSLGVALLVSSLGAILLSDLPKVISSFSILRDNFKSRFGSQEELNPSDKSDNTSSDTY
ncbi:uncharacterized protein LOC132754047 [Ruditapes philippinarum]|uniref:uncharacterized protein LOC132754047 n=1 Tax=Ruditapes philippinarum TaxID=129788 RepID=UPI00295B36B5|nr:uncharacterized protein LOC132754047 [Ruditapes philippinarum]